MDVVAINNATFDPVDGRSPLILGPQSFGEVTNAVAGVAENPQPKIWYIIFGVALALLSWLGVAIGYLFYKGTGIWGLNNPADWGWAIVNFVWWVGIGHAGTLISAVLYLFRQHWRTSINRASEAMTIFAVICALTFPTIHVGRVWFLYWFIPVPNQMAMWPNFRSPLLWDFFAVGTYGTVSALFWYTGLVPDLATMRDRAKSQLGKLLYGTFALGWRGSNRHWQHYERAYLILAALATPLVLSVHSIVSFDFAVAQLPGWHTTIFPPYFVAGAIFSGFAMVLTLMIPIRHIYSLEHIITPRHLENTAKVMLLTGSLVGYAYAMEFFIAWYSGNEYETFAFANRAFGPYAWAYWIMISCNVLTPQIFWFKKNRLNTKVLWIASIFVNIGMWFERFVIAVTSLHRDFLPSSWDYYSPTFWDITTYLGTFGLFFTLFMLFVRFLPVVAIAEIKAVMPIADPHYHADDNGDESSNASTESEVFEEVPQSDAAPDTSPEPPQAEDTTKGSDDGPDAPSTPVAESAAKEDNE